MLKLMGKKIFTILCSKILFTCGLHGYFSFGCGENWHDPVRCRYLRKWIKKCDDDSETSNWIAANTKVCKKKMSHNM